MLQATVANRTNVDESEMAAMDTSTLAHETSSGTEDPNEIPAELTSFVESRCRPAVFFFLNEPLEASHAYAFRDALGDRRFDELDVVINSTGGNIDAAYQIVELLRLRVGKIHACVPFYAKSAATLLCVGCDTITLDELAQLGPLDAQVYEEHESGKGEYVSALNAFKTLEQLHTFAIDTLDAATQVISTRSGMAMSACFKEAVAFVEATTGPLFAKLNPEKLGEYNRALTVGEEYCKRLFRRYTTWDESTAAGVAHRLVYAYPSHGYIIDFNELRNMGFEASLFQDGEQPAAQGLRAYIDGTFVVLVEPQ